MNHSFIPLKLKIGVAIWFGEGIKFIEIKCEGTVDANFL